MALSILPLVKSMILSEDVLPGPAGTGNVHLMNVFNSIRLRDQSVLPHLHPQICVFLQLTGWIGEIAGSIQVRRADNAEVVFTSSEHPIVFRDRLQVKWVLFRLTDCPFPAQGVYWVEFYCDGRWVIDQALQMRG